MNFSVKEEVKRLKAYTVEGARPVMKMDANESPYEMQDAIIDRLKESITYKNLNRYPDARASLLCSKLAAYVGMGIDEDSVIVGDGSDELINIIISAYLPKGEPILLPTPGFAMYNIFTSINEGKVIQFERNYNFNLDIDNMIEVIKQEKPRLVFLCNPNNPTGTLTNRESIIRLVENSEAVVVIDEAYYEFSGLTVADLIKRYDNLIVLRTLSKAWGLAGLRLGYLISNKGVINELLKVKSPYNVNSITQEVAKIALDYKNSMRERVDLILKEREYLIGALQSINCLRVFDTSANFIMIKVPDADGLSEELRKSGIAIRNFNNYQGLSNCVRITVGTREENDKLVKVIRLFEGE